MKRLVYAILFYLPMGAAAGPGPKAGAVDSGAAVVAGVVRFRFENLIDGLEAKDSMLIIFDRYDRAGAGVVRRVFVADGEHGVTVAGVAAGKYYVTVQCLGLHRDRVERVVTIRAQRTEAVRLRLKPVEVFSKQDVVIPDFHPDPTDLAVVRIK